MHFVAYFDCIFVFEMRFLSTSFQNGAHMRYAVASTVVAFTQHVQAPPLTEIQRYRTLNIAMWLKYTTAHFLPETAIYVHT